MVHFFLLESLPSIWPSQPHLICEKWPVPFKAQSFLLLQKEEILESYRVCLTLEKGRITKPWQGKKCKCVSGTIGTRHSNSQDTHLLDGGHHSLSIQVSFLQRVANMNEHGQLSNNTSYYIREEWFYFLVSVKNSQRILIGICEGRLWGKVTK